MAKVIDPKSLDAIYSNATNFKNRTAEAVEEIRVHINRLSNPDFIDGLRGGQGDAAVEAILEGKVALEELMEALSKTARFIDDKLAKAQDLARDRSGFGNAKDKNKSAAQNMSLKRT